MAGSRRLFEFALPEGFHYREDFISSANEGALLEAIGQVAFREFEMRGVVARRRVAFFGESYDRTVAQPLPDFLLPLRISFAMALINEYPPGAPIGWHRDAPQYGVVAGVSLLSECQMKFRPYQAPSSPIGSPLLRRTASHAIVLAPRSAYLMTQASRNAYEHHIPPVAALRYSITFRTRR
jgi:hypothetical protein